MIKNMDNGSVFMKLHQRIASTMILVITLLLWITGMITFYVMNNSVELQNKNSVKDMAYTVSTMDIIKESLYYKDASSIIQDRIEQIRQNTRFQYIIVTDMDGIRYAYPNENGIGRVYKGIGLQDVLINGKSYVVEDKNQFISALWGVSPIYYEDKQVGAVLVGLLNETVEQGVSHYDLYIILSILVAMLIGGGSAWFLSKSIKKNIFGLEPKEIAFLLGERDLMLHNLKNGIIAVDKNKNIVFCNEASNHILDINSLQEGQNICTEECNFWKDIIDVLEREKSIYNKEVKINNTKTLLSSFRVLRDHSRNVFGVLASFQDLTEAKALAEELTGVKKITDSLRAQNHEFLNKLYTISGLIQLEEYDQALEYITKTYEGNKNLSETLDKGIKDNQLCALLLSKTNRAKEAKIAVEIDNESRLDVLPQGLSMEELCSIVGNLYENAMEATRGYENKKIYISIRTYENELEVIVKDNGQGIDESIKTRIFEAGFTTKGTNRGYGLKIIKDIVENLDGRINLSTSNGTCWHIVIPMKRR